MARFEVSAGIVVPVRIITLTDEYKRARPIAMSSLVQLSGLSLSIRNQPPALVKARRTNDPSAIVGFSEGWHPDPLRKYEFLHFTAETTISITDAYLERPERYSEEEKQEILADFAYGMVIEELESLICNVLTATIIALPGSIKSERFVAIVNGKLYPQILPRMTSHFDESVEWAAEHGWPPIRDLPIATTWKWFSELDGLQIGVVPGPVGRAVAALTHLIFEESGVRDAGSDLIWALLGLEAIYGRGSSGIAEQLKEKSEVLLGESKDQKKQFNAAYDFRSRFVHGDLNIPLWHYQWFDDDKIKKFYDKDAESAWFVTSLLLSTIQELVVRGLHDVSFSYKLST
jgi:hypothetical protein